MPKTKKKFDWEVYDEQGEFVDIITMTRDEMKRYKEEFPHYNLLEVGYNDDGRDSAW